MTSEAESEKAAAAKIDGAGTWFGLATFAVAGAALFLVSKSLARQIGEEWAYDIVLIPAFCAVFIVGPAKRLYERYAWRRYCATNGHVIWELDANDGRHVVTCKRCDYLRIGQ